MEFGVVTFYKYIKISNPQKLTEKIRKLCEKLDLFGRILIAGEGINAGVSGEKKKMDKFKLGIKKNKLFSDISFREQECERNTYHKLVVRTRKEIVSFEEKISLDKRGKYIDPKKLNEWINGKEDFVLLDVRNDYETKVGKFKNALTLSIENFRDFPAEIKKLQHLKDKKIVTYCTGGVRCEKASSYMKENEFKNVRQLRGGIINHIGKFPDDFLGSCFVFDDRLVSRLNDPISECEICGKNCNIYINCHNLDCDKLFVCCDECMGKMNKACSAECKNSPKQRKEIATN